MFGIENLFAIGLGTNELIIILVIVLVLFGGAKIPQLLRGVGRGVGELQKGLEEGKRVLNSAAADDDERPTKPAKSTDSV